MSSTFGNHQPVEMANVFIAIINIIFHHSIGWTTFFSQVMCDIWLFDSETNNLIHFFSWMFLKFFVYNKGSYSAWFFPRKDYYDRRVLSYSFTEKTIIVFLLSNVSCFISRQNRSLTVVILLLWFLLRPAGIITFETLCLNSYY